MVFHILRQILVPTSGAGKRSLLNDVAPSLSISFFAADKNRRRLARAMEAAVSGHVWTIGDIVGLLDLEPGGHK
jgi:hypothetical protein